MICVIEVIDGPGKKARYWVHAQRSVEIGRHSKADISIPADRYLSRRHLLVHSEGHGFAMRDLNSANGTFVNGKRLDRCHLQTGDRIVAGETGFLVLLRDDDSDPHQPDGIFFPQVASPSERWFGLDNPSLPTRKLAFPKSDRQLESRAWESRGDRTRSLNGPRLWLLATVVRSMEHGSVDRPQGSETMSRLSHPSHSNV
jgi:hypothetical protein